MFSRPPRKAVRQSTPFSASTTPANGVSRLHPSGCAGTRSLRQRRLQRCLQQQLASDGALDRRYDGERPTVTPQPVLRLSLRCLWRAMRCLRALKPPCVPSARSRMGSQMGGSFSLELVGGDVESGVVHPSRRLVSSRLRAFIDLLIRIFRPRSVRLDEGSMRHAKAGRFSATDHTSRRQSVGVLIQLLRHPLTRPPQSRNPFEPTCPTLLLLQCCRAILLSRQIRNLPPRQVRYPNEHNLASLLGLSGQAGLRS